MTAKVHRRLCIAMVAASLGFCGCGPGSPTTEEQQKILVDARAVLRQSAQAPDAATRAVAMEAMAQVQGVQAGPTIRGGLDDSDPMVRFASAMALGDIVYKPALTALREKARLMVGERDKRSYCAVIYALFRLGDISHLGELADLLQDREAAVRANAAMTMGKIGNPSAISPIKMVLVDERDEGTKYAMYEALAALGDAASQALLESYTRGPYLDLRMASIPALAKEYTPKNLQILRELQTSRQAPRVRVLAATALARLGEVSAEGYNVCSRCARDPRKEMERGEGGDQVVTGVEVNSLQRLAAIGLGLMGNPSAITTLQPLLSASDGPVRVAAAMAIMRLAGPVAAEAAPAPARTAAAPVALPAPTPRGPRLESAGAKD